MAAICSLDELGGGGASSWKLMAGVTLFCAWLASPLSSDSKMALRMVFTRAARAASWDALPAAAATTRGLVVAPSRSAPSVVSVSGLLGMEISLTGRRLPSSSCDIHVSCDSCVLERFTAGGDSKMSDGGLLIVGSRPRGVEKEVGGKPDACCGSCCF